jgi:hypothetical protein
MSNKFNEDNELNEIDDLNETDEQLNEGGGNWDKFIDDICQREDAARSREKILAEQKNNSPQRRYNELYREKWQNRVTWGTKK